MSTLTLSRDEVEKVLRDTKGGFFTVVFTKRTTGEKRTMKASLNYKSLLKGGQAKYDFASKQLLVVRDCEKQAIRSIPWDAVLEIRANKNVYTISQ